MSTVHSKLQDSNSTRLSFHQRENHPNPARSLVAGTRLPQGTGKQHRLTPYASIRRWVQSLPNESISFLVSFVFHLLFILFLAILTFGIPSSTRPILLTINQPEQSLGTFAIDTGSDESLEQLDVQDPTLQEMPSLSSIVLSTPAELDDPRQKAVPFSTANLIAAETDLVSASFTHDKDGGLGPRASGLFQNSGIEDRLQRRGNALNQGASKESEQAVEAALQWLVAHQMPDGSWNSEMTDACNSRCRNGTIEAGRGKPIASTGLALLCFLGAGQTHRKGDYKPTVEKGLYFLTERIQKADVGTKSRGRFLDDSAPYEMYEQGIAVLALCEAYQMTGDSELRFPAESGIDFIQKAQHPDGSWGYRPRVSGDLSIVGWQMMALKSAAHIGFRVKRETIEKSDAFLTSQSSDYGAYYGYRSTQREPCTTAIGLLIRLYRNWSKSDPNILKGVDYIADLGPSIDGIYYNYYATALLFQFKGDRWENWNRTCRDYLVREQSKEGHEKGSWYFGRNHFNQVGGRLYCTAMATLTLEVYYRHMPIYEDIKTDAFAL